MFYQKFMAVRKNPVALHCEGVLAAFLSRSQAKIVKKLQKHCFFYFDAV